MSKTHHSSRDKDMKKKPMHTLKEKRAAKHAKKHEHDAQPLVPQNTTH